MVQPRYLSPAGRGRIALARSGSRGSALRVIAPSPGMGARRPFRPLPCGERWTCWLDLNETRSSAKGRWRMSDQTVVRHKRGGLYFEDFVVGRLYEHPLTRTVTQMDNMLFSNMTLNPQPLHIDRHFCEHETEWGQPLMNSLFTLGLTLGISVNDSPADPTFANLGMTDVKFPAPLFEGDTVRCETTVLGKRASKSRPNAGIVDFHHRAY